MAVSSGKCRSAESNIADSINDILAGISSKTIAYDMVPVIPMSEPSGKLVFVDLPSEMYAV